VKVSFKSRHTSTSRLSSTMPRETKGSMPYGKETFTPLDLTEQWKSRLNNEKMGFARVDMTGTNTSLSMVWAPDSSLDNQDGRGRGSRRRQSEFRLMYDLGYRGDRLQPTGTLPGLGGRASEAGPATAAARAQDRPGSHASMRADPAYATPRSTTQESQWLTPSIKDEILRLRGAEAERVRLSRAAELRKVGEIYLRTGNLAAAKSHFVRAEQLLGMDAQRYQMHRDHLYASVEYRMSEIPRGDSFL